MDRGRIAVLTIGLVAILALAERRAAGDEPQLTPTAQRLSPAGDTAWFFGRPTDVAASPDGALIAVKHTHGVELFDMRTHRRRASLTLHDVRWDNSPELGGGGSFGLAWARNGRTLWATDSYVGLHEIHVPPNGKATWGRTIVLTGRRHDKPFPTAPTGIALDEAHHRAFVALANADAVGVVDLTRGRLAALIPVGVAPVGIVRVGARLYVTNQGRAPEPGEAGDRVAPSGDSTVRVDGRGVAAGGSLAVVDVARGAVVAGANVPAGTAFIVASRDARTLFAASPTSGEVLAIDRLTLRARHYRFDDGLRGRAPSALAESRDGRRLWVALAGMNAVVDLDLASGAVRGALTTLWYPDGVALDRRSGALAVVALKGDGRASEEHALRRGPQKRLAGANVFDYAGAAEFVAHPKAALHPYVAMPARRREGPLPPLRHVVYIIKENRTYDDVLGDVPEGDGDARLCVFCDVTPNEHALARDFVLLDGFHVNGMISGDGHQWTSQDDATDYIERAMGGFTRSYPSDGTDPLAYAASGFLWDRVLDKGLAFRDYGEFITSGPPMVPAKATWSDVWADYRNGTHHVRFSRRVDIARLRPHVVPGYPAFDLRIPDQVRADAFIGDMRAMWARGTMPALSLVLLGNDHTSGDSPGYPTPRAAVADNDRALGRIVEALTHGPFWRDTVILVTEDDALDGVDHVDAHRTTAFVVSPYTRGRGHDGSFYNQSSFVRLIERILQLPPATIFDQQAPDIAAVFRSSSDPAPYDALPSVVPLDELNPPTRKAAIQIDPVRPDSTDPAAMRAVIRRRSGRST